MNSIDASTPSTRTRRVALDSRTPGRSILRASVAARLGAVAVISAALWLSILWALT
jgi:hypothetical protein